MKFVRFTEKNVDGCGNDAEVIIKVNSDVKVNNNELEGIIARKKSEAAAEDWDTDSLVDAACEEYFGKRNISYSSEDIIEIEF